MKVLFLGTPEFAVPTLQALLTGPHPVVAVMTRPDRPRGRSGRPQPSPVKRAAEGGGLPILQPERVNRQETYDALRALEADVAVVVAFGCILSAEFLSIPRLGCVNLHASLLPAYRGAAPIQWAVANGETETGLTTMQMDTGMDTGDILLQRLVPVDPEEDAARLADRLAPLGGPLMLETLAGLEDGSIRPRPQAADRATRAPLLRREHGRIDWTRPAGAIRDLARGMQPWPVAYAQAAGGELRVFRASVADGREPASEPGTVLGPRGDAALVACGGGSLLALEQVQPASRRRMSGREALNGRALSAGGRLG